MGRALLVLAVLCCGVRSSFPAQPSERDVRAMYEQYPFPPLPISRSDQIASTHIPRAGNGMTRKFVGPSHLVVS